MINVLGGIDTTSAALTAERIRMNVVTQNIANANTVRGIDGKPYQRQQVVFESVLRDQMMGSGMPAGQQSIRVARVENDNRPPRIVYDPHRGPIEMPAINIYEEMVDMVTSSRTFEANLSVMKTSRMMAMQTLAIGKR